MENPAYDVMTVLRYMTDYMTDPHRHDGRHDSLGALVTCDKKLSEKRGFLLTNHIIWLAKMFSNNFASYLYHDLLIYFSKSK